MDDTLSSDAIDTAADRIGGPHAPGDTVGRYVIAQLLGRGATSVVYAAYDPELGRTIALKIIGSRHEIRRSRLLKEARALASINHPNVVTVHDVGSTDESMFIAMELVPGRTLRRWHESQPARVERVDVLAKIARGLGAAHRAGLVHRDVKPDNVMISEQGRVVVLDFGLVQIGESEIGQGLPTGHLMAVETQTQGRVGTPAYMAPEQYAGGTTSAKSDQFSFCVLAWELLYEERPFPGVPAASTTARDVARHRRVDRRLHAALSRGLEAEPADRWPTLEPLIEVLERRPWSGATYLAGLSVIALGGAAAWAYARPDPHCSDPAASVAEVWNPAERATLLQAADGDEIVLAPVDRYAEQLELTWGTACEVTEGGKRPAFESLDRCLLLREHALATTLDAIGEASGMNARRIIDALDQLPDPARCLSDPAFRAPAPDAALAGVVDELARELGRVRSLYNVGRKKEAVEQLDALVPRIEAHGYLPQLAHARLERANYASQLSEPDRVQRLEDAYRLSVRAEDDESAALAATGLTREYGSVASRGDAARAWATVARAHIANTDLGAEDELRIDEILAGLLAREGKSEESLEAHRVALARAESELSADSVLRWTLNSNVATTLSRVHRSREAKLYYAAARDGLERRYGPNSVIVAHHLANEGYNLAQLEAFDEAEALLKRAIDIVEGHLGPDHPLSVVARSNLARVRLFRGDVDGAAEAGEGTIEMAVARFGEEHVVTSVVILRVGMVHERAGRLEQAEAAFVRADASFVAAAAEDDPRRWRSLAELGNLALRRGQPGEARALLADAAQRVSGDSSADRFDAAMIELRLGRAEIGSEHDVDGGRARARKAAAVLNEAGRHWDFIRPELAEFLPSP